jgi:hypothetical protein
MAKKNSKQQSKQPNAANCGDTSKTMSTLTTTSAVTVPTVPPVNTTSTSPAPSPYKPITDTVSIERLVGLAKDSPPDSALGIVWRRAYEEGYENGRKSLLQNLEKKLKEKFEEGQKEGIEKSKERYYGKGIVKGEYEEHERWKAAGHGQLCFVPIAILEDSGTQTDLPATSTTSVSVQTNPTTSLTTSQSAALFGNSKNAKIVTTCENYCENSSYNTSPTSSATFSDSTTPLTTITALETQPVTAGFTKKHQKVKKTSISSQTTPEIPPPSIVEHTDDVTQVHMSLLTPNNVVSQPPTPTTTASTSQPPAVTGHEKSALLRAVFESQAPMGSPAPTTIVTALETRSATAGFMKKHQNIEKTPIFTPKLLEPPVSMRFSWADDTAELPIVSTVPMKQPRDLSDLRSPAKNPFSSLQHRRHQKFNKNRLYFINSKPQYHRYNSFSGSHRLHFQKSHHHSQLQVPFTASLNWDRDPRLLDLNNALKALGWIRR